MPIFLEPNREFPVVLESDKGKSPEPTFYARALSMRMQAEVSDVLDKWLGNVNFDELLAATVDVLLKVFTRIENMPGELSKDWLMQLSYNEARELLRTVLMNNHLDHNAKKE